MREPAGSVRQMSSGVRIERLNPEELLRLVQTQQRQIAALEEMGRALQREGEQLKRHQQRQAAPFSKEQPVATPKRPGRRPGQGAFGRRTAPAPAAVTEPEVAVPVTVVACPACGGVLGEERHEAASVTELPAVPQPQVTLYRVAARTCTACGKTVRGQHPALAADQRGATAHRLGPRLLSAAHALHYQHGVPVQRVPGILEALTGARVTASALTQDALRQAQGGVGTATETLRKEMAQAERVHTDDTGWRVGGRSAFLLGFTTPTATLYRIRARHRNEEVREVIGDAFAGVLCTDRGKSYDAAALAEVKQQKCLAHLQRSASAVLETKWGRGRSFARALKALLHEGLALWQAYQAGSVEDFDAQRAALRQRLDHHLRERTLPDPDNQRLLDQLRWHHQRGNLLRFLDDPRIEPTNNRAERALRPAVIARKVSQCSKTEAGAAAFAAFASVTRTAVQQHQPVIDRLAALRRAPPPRSPAPDRR